MTVSELHLQGEEPEGVLNSLSNKMGGKSETKQKVQRSIGAWEAMAWLVLCTVMARIRPPYNMVSLSGHTATVSWGNSVESGLPIRVSSHKPYDALKTGVR